MPDELVVCKSCSCLFDLEYHITVLDGEPCVLCPKCGQIFHDIERCPKCGHAEEDKGMTVEDGEKGTVFVCSRCGHRWGVEEPYARAYPPVKCAHCRREQGFQETRSVGYREYFKCKCGEEWDEARYPEACPRCGCDPKTEVPEFHIEPGFFVCGFCKRDFPSQDYWADYWRS